MLKFQIGLYYMLLHPLEGSITFLAQDPCRAAEGGAAGVAGDKCDSLCCLTQFGMMLHYVYRL